MNPNLIPSYDLLGLPAPAWLAQALMALTLALHWAFLGGAVGGTALLLLNALRGKRSPELAELSRRLTPFLPFFLSMAMTLGIAPLLFVQVLYGQFFYTANILLGWWWLGLLGLLIAAFYLMWFAWHRQGQGKPLGFVLPALVLVVLAKAAVILSSNATLTQSPEAWATVWARGMNRLFTGDPTLVPRVLFALSGFLTTGGLLVAVLAQAGILPAAGKRTGLSLTLPASVGQGAFGAWLMFSFGAERTWLWLMAMGGETGFFLIASLIASLAFGAVIPLTGFAWRSRSLIWLGIPALTQFIGLLAWAAARDALRRAALSPVYSPATVAVHSQWDGFALFAVVFVSALGVIAWLVKQSLPAARA